MKTVKEIKEMHLEWCSGRIGDINTIGGLFQVVIGITEHLEAQAKPTVFQPFCQTVSASDNFAGESVATVSTTCDACKPEIRREAMIEALRWECGKCGGCTSCEKNKDCRVPQAIARLENGGDL